MGSRNCPNCGAPLESGVRCGHCGADWSAPVGAKADGPRYHWAAFVSLGLSFPTFLVIQAPYVGFIFSGFSLFMGYDALRAIRRNPKKYRGRAVAFAGMAISAYTTVTMLEVVRMYRGFGL
ncbi:MAG: zinc ribbon domain-containing protein [Deltaproteobacteria bacterium]|nr:zinc ribbon domain-containing protein [Deltaproteobacteria bacterium]